VLRSIAHRKENLSLDRDAVLSDECSISNTAEMEIVHTCESVVNFHKSTRRHIPEIRVTVVRNLIISYVRRILTLSHSAEYKNDLHNHKDSNVSCHICFNYV